MSDDTSSCCTRWVHTVVTVLLLGGWITAWAADPRPAATSAGPDAASRGICCSETARRPTATPILSKDGGLITAYKESYALLIGVSDYTAGWPDLESIPKEMHQLSAALREQGFHITTLLNPTGRTLEKGVKEFILGHGYEPDNRLLMFFSGHGYTRLDGRKGYLVPADAPDPLRDERGFLAKALPMEQILAWARQIEAKHALFLFDSCFSGTIFKTKSLPRIPARISRLTAAPVRQFITAGTAGEEVPAQSVFTPAFIDAIRSGLADQDRDGYITGTELGLYLQRTVPRFANQTPQYGKINDYELSRGDFVFAVRSHPGGTLDALDTPALSATGELIVETSPEGAEIWIDGITTTRGNAPLVASTLPAGEVEVTVQMPGYEKVTRKVLIRPGQTTRLAIQLTPSAEGLQVVSEPPQADWYLDGVFIGQTPDRLAQLAPGPHKITVRKKGYQDWVKEIVYQPKDSPVVVARLTPVQAEPKTFELTVNATPPEAKITLKNIPDPYRPGIKLTPGKYLLEVSAPGYQTATSWVEITTSSRVISVALQRLTPVSRVYRPGEVFRDPLPGERFGPEMVVVPAGSFWLGSRDPRKLYRFDESPRRRIHIGRPFAVGKYEVTFDDYDLFAASTGRDKPSDEGWGRGQRPVINVSWEDARAYVQWLRETTGQPYRLLTEAEWEYVARAGTDTPYWWGSDIGTDNARCFQCGNKWALPGTSEVGYFSANAFGLHDTAGNVWEWVQDCYIDNYRQMPANGRARTDANCPRRVLRGGAWNSRPVLLRSAERGAEEAQPFAIGFRVARDLPASTLVER